MRLPTIQFSLLGLLSAITVFGIALACILKFGLSLPMVTIVWSLLLVVLMATPVLAHVGKPERRTFYAGFAWFGWIYSLVFMFGSVTHTPISFGPSAMRSTSPIRFPHMFIEHGIFIFYKWVVPPGSRLLSSEDPDSQYQNLASQYDSGIWNPPTAVPPGGLGGGGFFGGGGGGFGATPFPAGGGAFGGTTMPTTSLKPYRFIPWESFRDVAHALLTALWAILGGLVTMYLARRNVHRREPSVIPTP